MKKNILTLICAVTLSMSSFIDVHARSAMDTVSNARSFDTGIYTTKSGKLNINVVKENINTPTVIQLTSPNGKVFHTETISKRNKKFAIQFNMDDLAPGDYLLSIISNGEKQTKDIKIVYPMLERTISISPFREI